MSEEAYKPNSVLRQLAEMAIIYLPIRLLSGSSELLFTEVLHEMQFFWLTLAPR